MCTDIGEAASCFRSMQVKSTKQLVVYVLSYYINNSVPQAVVAAAGFHSTKERYRAPWAEVDVQESLAKSIFPWAEHEIGRLVQMAEQSGGDINVGVLNTLEMLVKLRPFVIRVCTVTNVHLWSG